MNTQIFTQNYYETELVLDALIGCVTSDDKDYNEDQTWTDAAIVDVFSPLIAAANPRISTLDQLFVILHNDALGRPVTAEKWLFEDYMGASIMTILRSVTVANGELFHCIGVQSFDKTRLLVLQNRTA